MENLELLAVAKVIKAKAVKEASASIEPGQYEIDALIRVKGQLTKGEDFEQTLPNKIKWPVLFSLIASKVNKETLAIVLKQYKEAIKTGDFEALEKDTKKTVQNKVDKLIDKTVSTVSGKVTTNMSAEVVGQSQIKAA